MLKTRKSRLLQSCRLGLSAVALGQLIVSPVLANGLQSSAAPVTLSPIKHVIVIIGENRSFDHVFATYVPKPKGETVSNLLSKGIIQLDGNKDAIPGPNFQNAQQLSAQDVGTTDAFLLSPPKQEFPQNQLPAPLVGGPLVSYIPNQCGSTPITSCEASLALAQQSESGLDPDYYQYLLTGGTGQTSATPDQRISNVSTLPAGPFQLTNNSSLPYDAYAQSPVHRFYQMWQQLNCNTSAASKDNPSGCNGNLFAWVEVSVGAGTNGATQPSNFSTNYAAGAITTGEGSTALGCYNVQKGDVPYFNSLVQKYAMSDNFHQSVNGGTGANHIMFGHADMLYFSDGKGNATEPPNGVKVFTKKYMGAANPDAGVVNEIENPNPAPETNNWYTEDGYGNSFNSGFPPPFSAAPAFGGGSYSNCSDSDQPGVKPILQYLKKLQINPNCESGHYYLLNNYNPGYFGDGSRADTDQNPSNTPFTIPPQTRKSIGDSLNDKGISWKD